ncbi:TolC family protein [Pseudomonas juntendi]|nr:TolC family protein [Pseudomonas juntendi]
MDTGWPDSVEAGCCDPRNAFDPDWRAFVSDSRLRRLIELALVDNRDLQQAAASVAQARAGYQGAAAALYPSLGVDTYAGRAKLPALEQTPGAAPAPAVWPTPSRPPWGSRPMSWTSSAGHEARPMRPRRAFMPRWPTTRLHAWP